jgi:predicted ribonuclease YlaK
MSPRPVAFIDAEIARQITNLQRLRDDLDRRQRRAMSAQGHITVVDTHVLLHHELADSVNSPEVVGQPNVRLVIPLRVIEELDAKKYTDSARIRAKARGLMPKLRALIGTEGLPTPLRDGTTIEVFVEPGTRMRPSDADTEIIGTAHDLHRLTRQPVSILTSDMAMAIRVETEGIPVVELPEKYLREQ